MKWMMQVAEERQVTRKEFNYKMKVLLIKYTIFTNIENMRV